MARVYLEMSYVVANVNTLEHLRTICRRVGYVPPQIVPQDV